MAVKIPSHFHYLVVLDEQFSYIAEITQSSELKYSIAVNTLNLKFKTYYLFLGDGSVIL